MKPLNKKILTDEPVNLEEFLEEIKRSEEQKYLFGSAIMIQLNGQLINKKNISKTILYKDDIICIYPLLGGG